MQDPLTPLKQSADVLETLKKYGLPASQALLVLALGVACWKFPDWCKAHWRWLVVAAVSYEVLVLILVPLIGGCVTFLRELWEKHFKDNLLSATASWLKALPVKYSPGFFTRYRHHFALDHKVFNVKSP